MNPSYNNGNGSGAGGQPNGSDAAGGVSGGVGTGVSGGIFSRNESGGGMTGAPGAAGVPGAKPGVIASGPDPADMPDEKPAGLSLGSNRHLFRRPRAQAPRNFVMNVGGGAGTGMGAGAGRKSGGPKKGLIIGGLAVVVILIVALVVGMMLGGEGNGNTDTASLASPTTVREQFNSFYHYLTNNKPDDTKDVTVEDLIRTSFYIDNADLTAVQREKYLDMFDDELAEFIEVYSDTSGEQPLDNIYAYVYALHKLDEITIFELRDIYNSEGVAAARERLAAVYQNYDSDSSNGLLDAYIISEQEYLTAFIDSLETGDENGLSDKQMAAMQAKYTLQLAAYYDLEHLYSEVYDENLSEGTSA